MNVKVQVACSCASYNPSNPSVVCRAPTPTLEMIRSTRTNGRYVYTVLRYCVFLSWPFGCHVIFVWQLQLLYHEWSKWTNFYKFQPLTHIRFEIAYCFTNKRPSNGIGSLNCHIISQFPSTYIRVTRKRH